MPGNPVVFDSTWRVKVYCYAFGQVAINQYDYYVGNTAGGPTDVQLAEGMDTIAGAVYKAFLNVDALYCGVRVCQWLPLPILAGPVIGEVSRGRGTVGAAGGMIPSQVTVNIIKNTGLYGRGQHGMVKLPMFDQSFNSSGALTVAGAAAANAVRIAMLPTTGIILTPAAGVSISLYPSVGSPARKATATKPARPRGANVMQSSTVETILGSLRKRGGTGRPNPLPF